MKSLILTGLLALSGLLLAACGSNSSGGSDTTATCTTNSYGQLVSSNGQACSGLQAQCTQQGLLYNSATNQCVNSSGVGNGYGSGYGGSYGGYGGTQGVSCDYWNQVYAGYGYYVPMQVQGQYYCVNVQQYIPNYQQYDVSQLYGQSCQYSNCGGQYYSGSNLCFGVGAGAGSSYGISGYFSVCL